MRPQSTEAPRDVERPFVEFLNHGTLPFIGRQELISHLHAFCRDVAGGEALSLCLVEGEAGAGKTRLAARLAAELLEGGKQALRIRLYPDASLDVARLCALAISAATPLPPAERRVSRSSIEELRRRCQTRPVVLLVEDVHLLGGDAARSFGDFLYALADLPLPVLLFTRPLGDALRGIVEPYRQTGLDLNGMTAADVAGLWEAVFEETPAAGSVEEIMKATRGNPLALRSGFRLIAEEMARTRSAGPVGERAGALFRHSASLLAEGLIAHLTPEEREAAGIVSTLGEVFDLRTARELLAEKSGTIERLAFKGVIRQVESGEAASIVGTPSQQKPSAFTHTLIHQLLCEQNSLDPGRMISVIACGHPLYSITPFRMLTGEIPPEIEPCEVHLFGRALVTTAYFLNDSGDNGGATLLRSRIDTLLETAAPRLTDEQRLDIALNARRFDLNNRELWKNTERFRAEVDHALEETSDLPESLLKHRIGLLRYKQMLEYHAPLEEAVDAQLWQPWEEVSVVIARHPDLRRTVDYARYMATAAQVARFTGNTTMARSLQREVVRTLADDDLPESSRKQLLCHAFSRLCPLFTTTEGLKEGVRQLELIEAEYHDIRTSFQRLGLHVQIGDYALARKLARYVRQKAEQQGLWGLAYGADYYLISLEQRAEIPPEELIAKLRLLYRSYQPRIDKRYASQLCEQILSVAIIADRVDLLKQHADEFGHLLPLCEPEIRLLVALLCNRSSVPAARKWFAPDSIVSSLTALLLGEDRMITQEQLLSLELPVLRISEVAELWLLIVLVERLEEQGRGDRVAETRAYLLKRICRMLDWLADHDVVAPMLPLIRHVGTGLPDHDRVRWLDIIRTAARGSRTTIDDRRGRRLRVIGSFALGDEGSAATPIRGRRMQAMVGALVAAQLMGKELDREELVELASGEKYSLQSRKVVNTAIKRLRDIFGRDGIITDEEGLPGLNVGSVEVDILRQREQHRQAIDDLHAGNLARAGELLESALAIASQGVPFPGLYDPLYDRIREDMESSLREATILIGRRLLEAGAPDMAAELARQATLAMPGDEELSELLCESLLQRHASADAELLLRRGRNASDDSYN